MEQDPTNATLIEREDLTETLSIIKVRPDSRTVPPFVPGQFVRLGLPRAPESANPNRPTRRPGRIRYTRRAYSIASSPRATDHMEFFVVRIEEGALTPKMWDLTPGSRIWMDEEAKGEFNIDLAPRGKDLVLVSTGTGIAPFISMYRTFKDEQRWRRFVVINGVRYAADLGYREELAAAEHDDPSVTYIPLVTREPEGALWQGLRGRVHVALEPELYERLVGAPLDPTQCHVFLCGNPAMIDELEENLTSRGFITDSRQGPGTLHFERYW